jgi:hypothetical protein
LTFVIESGFSYYLLREWRNPDLFWTEMFIGDDYNFMNTMLGFNGGQSFKFESGYTLTPEDYLPTSYTPSILAVGGRQVLGGVKPRRGLEINAETGDLDAVPLSSDLITLDRVVICRIDNLLCKRIPLLWVYCRDQYRF